MPPFGAVLQRDADTLNFLARAERGAVRFSTASGYDAIIDNGRRKRASGINRSEDQELAPFDRWRLYTGARDIACNFAIAGWMIRQKKAAIHHTGRRFPADCLYELMPQRFASSVIALAWRNDGWPLFPAPEGIPPRGPSG